MEKLKELEDAIFNNNLDKLIFIIKDIVPEWNSKNYN
jgi:hypothetical protein